jgi:uncharacterized phage protein gp47/JayE
VTITTVAPTIDASGITAPVYADVLAFVQGQYATIFGSDTYIAPDSQDGQFIALMALAFTDCNAAAVAIYNSFSPSTASGRALQSNVKINGITVNQATNSTVDVDIGGTVGTTITNGQVRDSNQNLWNLPANVTIPSAGTITVTATAVNVGAIRADPATVTQIATPTRGWQTVNNAAAAVPGDAIETDAELRARQILSVALPSQTVLDGMIGAVSNVPGVTRVVGLENDTNITDANGIPAYNTAFVVEGGDVNAIAPAIALKKTLGSPTFGSTSVTITNVYGQPQVIKFSRPVGVPITVAITVKALAGYSASVGTAAVNAVIAYINALPLGGGIAKAVEWGDLIEAVKSVPLSSTFSLTSLTLKKGAGSLAPADVPLAFNEAASATIGTVTVVAT